MTMTKEEVEAKEVWEEQLLYTANYIRHCHDLNIGYSDDGLDYLQSALDLSILLTNAWVDGDLLQTLRDLSKPLEDQTYAYDDIILREIDNYACDGVAPKLIDYCRR